MAYDEETADAEACRLEHQLDDELAGRMAELIAFFESDSDAAAAWREHLTEHLDSEKS
jgi:Mn-dependent DtxR family transcriptional regulator